MNKKLLEPVLWFVLGVFGISMINYLILMLAIMVFSISDGYDLLVFTIFSVLIIGILGVLIIGIFFGWKRPLVSGVKVGLVLDAILGFYYMIMMIIAMAKCC